MEDENSKQNYKRIKLSKNKRRRLSNNFHKVNLFFISFKNVDNLFLFLIL